MITRIRAHAQRVPAPGQRRQRAARRLAGHRRTAAPWPSGSTTWTRPGTGRSTCATSSRRSSGSASSGSWAPPIEADFEAHHSLRRRTDYYRAELSAAAERGLGLYACRCSRSQLTGPPTGGCPGGCRDAGHAYAAGETSIRAQRARRRLPGDRRRRPVATRRPPRVPPRLGHRGSRSGRHARRPRRGPASLDAGPALPGALPGRGVVQLRRASSTTHSSPTRAAPSSPSRRWARRAAGTAPRQLRDVDPARSSTRHRSRGRHHSAGVTSRAG